MGRGPGLPVPQGQPPSPGKRRLRGPKKKLLAQKVANPCKRWRGTAGVATPGLPCGRRRWRKDNPWREGAARGDPLPALVPRISEQPALGVHRRGPSWGIAGSNENSYARLDELEAGASDDRGRCSVGIIASPWARDWGGCAYRRLSPFANPAVLLSIRAPAKASGGWQNV